MKGEANAILNTEIDTIPRMIADKTDILSALRFDNARQRLFCGVRKIRCGLNDNQKDGMYNSNRYKIIVN